MSEVSLSSDRTGEDGMLFFKTIEMYTRQQTRIGNDRYDRNSNQTDIAKFGQQTCVHLHTMSETKAGLVILANMD